MNDELTYFKRIFNFAFLAGVFDNRNTGELASKTENLYCNQKLLWILQSTTRWLSDVLGVYLFVG